MKGSTKRSRFEVLTHFARQGPRFGQRIRKEVFLRDAFVGGNRKSRNPSTTPLNSVSFHLRDIRPTNACH